MSTIASFSMSLSITILALLMLRVLVRKSGSLMDYILRRMLRG